MTSEFLVLKAHAFSSQEPFCSRLTEILAWDFSLEVKGGIFQREKLFMAIPFKRTWRGGGGGGGKK